MRGILQRVQVRPDDIATGSARARSTHHSAIIDAGLDFIHFESPMMELLSQYVRVRNELDAVRAAIDPLRRVLLDARPSANQLRAYYALQDRSNQAHEALRRLY